MSKCRLKIDHEKQSLKIFTNKKTHEKIIKFLLKRGPSAGRGLQPRPHVHAILSNKFFICHSILPSFPNRIKTQNQNYKPTF